MTGTKFITFGVCVVFRGFLTIATLWLVFRRMPKYCAAPNCRNDSGGRDCDRKSFYKFPLRDPARLQNWLKNMGREGWTPSRHQYLCHKHFTSSCFTMRWGIRYLTRDAVPTFFQHSGTVEKRRSLDTGEHKRGLTIEVPGVMAPAGEASLSQEEGSGVQLYTITVDPTQIREPLLLTEMGSMETVPLQDSQHTVGDNVLVNVYQTLEEFGEGNVVVLSEGSDLIVNDGTCHVASEAGTLLVDNMTLESLVPPAGQEEEHNQQVVAYFETIPNVLPATHSNPSFPSDTVLSSALSSVPIVSTLPIVSKHDSSPDSSLMPVDERTESEEALGEEVDDENMDQEILELDEHNYPKDNLSKEQLEAIVIKLQKKVKVLQQRHRRHLDKLLGLESTVSQLRHNNLLNEERLRLLERAYLQTSAAVTDGGETVAIICEEENMTYLYTLPQPDGQKDITKE